MKIIKHREFIESDEYQVFFPVHGPGWGFSFPSDADGNVDTASLADCALENYRKCEADAKAGTGVPGEVRCYHRHYTEPAVGRCDRCRANVTLQGFTNYCDCGAMYNSSGQELCDPSNWGEETGEHPADILRIP